MIAMVAWSLMVKQTRLARPVLLSHRIFLARRFHGAQDADA